MSKLVIMAAVVALGAGLGAALGSTRSCTDGGCPLTANPKRGAVWGGFLGLLFAMSLGPGTASAPAGAGAVESGPVIEVRTQDALEREVLEGPGASLVYFTAAWCPACIGFTPVINKVAADHAGGVRVAKVDVDKAAALAQEFGVQAVPTSIVFRDGKEVRRFTGAVSEDELVRALT